MIITTAQINQLLTAGGNFIIDATSMTLPQLRQLAKAAAATNANITLRNVGTRTVPQLKEIVAFAPGLITIDLT